MPSAPGGPFTRHDLPLLYALAMRADDDPVMFFIDATIMASIAMTSVAIGSLSNSKIL